MDVRRRFVSPDGERRYQQKHGQKVTDTTHRFIPRLAGGW
jgi:hypothetical protein